MIFGGEFINDSEGEALVLRNPAFAPDGDCVHEGCTNLLACNYDSLANVYDGTCLFPTQGFDCNGLCVDPSFGGPDVNCDSFVNVADLLSLLSYFGEEAGSNWDDNFPCLNPDTDCSGEVTVTDLLNILSFFGDEDSDGDGIMDSNDECIVVTSRDALLLPRATMIQMLQLTMAHAFFYVRDAQIILPAIMTHLLFKMTEPAYIP